MYRIIDKRASGKTCRLFLLAKEHNGVIVCANPRAMEEKARSYGIVGIDFIEYNEYVRTYPYLRDKSQPIFIDEIENFIKTTTYGQVMGYTLSAED